MKYLLEQIDRLITISLEGVKTEHRPHRGDSVEELLKIASDEKERVRLSLLNQIFKVKNEYQLVILISNFQSALIRLLNLLFINQSNGEPNREGFDLVIHALQVHLNELLQLLKESFSKHFDWDQAVPLQELENVKKENEQEIPALKDLLHGLGTDEVLIEVLLGFLQSPFSGLEVDRVRFRDIFFRRQLLGELSSIKKHKKNFQPYQSVQELLIFLNFNHVTFVSYMLQVFSRELADTEGLKENVERLQVLKNNLRIAAYKQNSGLYMKLPHVREQLLGWIDEELSLITLQEAAKQVPYKDQMNQVVNQMKIKLNLSVAQFGFLIKVFHQDKVISNSNQKEIIRFFATHFMTNKTEVISEGSLYGKYFKPEPSTIREVKNLLLQMIGLINSMKN